MALVKIEASFGSSLCLKVQIALNPKNVARKLYRMRLNN